ncbi:hypothetical protein [Nostoc sp.]
MTNLLQLLGRLGSAKPLDKKRSHNVKLTLIYNRCTPLQPIDYVAKIFENPMTKY